MQERTHFHGNLPGHLLAVILATSAQKKRDNLKRNCQCFYICSLLQNHHSEPTCSQTPI